MIIFKIIRTELQNLFYSPVPWFLAIIFLLQCAYFYLVPLYPHARVVDWMNTHGYALAITEDYDMSYTKNLFFLGDGIIEHVSENLYLFIPLLTMGLISREINTGTIKLLYSSPIKLRHIVLGKYLAVMTFVLLLIGILGFFMVLGAFQIRHVDYGLFLSALLGFCLLGGAYSAVGLFMSSLTNYQIISGIATFTLFFILTRIGGLWQQYDFVRDFTWFMSIAGRTEQMLAGLIVTRDVVYFIIIIFMFLSFTLFKLKGEKESRSWITKAARYLGVIVVSLLLGYITSRPALVGYLDATAEDVNTISPKMQQILKKMGKEPLEITLYCNLWGGNMGYGLPQARNYYLYGVWDKYVRFKPDMKFKYVYYYDNDDMYANYPKKTGKQISGIIADKIMLDSSMFISPQEIRKQMDPYSEDLNLFMTAKYKGDTINLRTYGGQDIWPNQQEVASKFKRLIEKKGPKVYFLTGNLERSIEKTGEREYSKHTTNKANRGSLVNAAFDVDTLSLEKQDIPADATALVLADPKTELGSATRKKLEQYIDAGGNLMVLCEPGKQEVVNPVLQQFGVQQMKGQLVQPSYNETPDRILAYNLKAALNVKQQDEINKQRAFKSKLPDTASRGGMIGGAALNYSEKGSFKITPIMKTFPDGPKISPIKKYPKDATPAQKSAILPIQRKTWVKMGHLVTDSVAPVFSPQDGDIKDSSFVATVLITRQINRKEQRAIVHGDADVLANIYGGSLDWYNWFDYGEHPVFTPTFHFQDGELTVTAPTVKILLIICLGILPGLLLLGGTILLIRRKRK